MHLPSTAITMELIFFSLPLLILIGLYKILSFEGLESAAKFQMSLMVLNPRKTEMIPKQVYKWIG